MGMNEQMELMIRIRAQGQEAAAQLKRIEDRMGRIKSAGKGAGAGLKSAFHFVEGGARRAGRGLRAVMAPLGWMAKGLGAASVAAAAFGGVALKASGDMETLRLRLDGVTASAEESKKIFEDVRQLGIASPFTEQQMADSAILLRQFALYSKQNLKTISDAAIVTQRDMQDVVMAIVGMEAEPLRRLGIQFSAAGGNFVAQYRTKLGEVKTESAKTRDEASQMLMDIFKVRFGGAAGAFNTSWKGGMARLTGGLQQVFARLGDGLRERLSKMLVGLNDRITELIDSGTLDEIGERIGAGVEAAVDRARAAFQTVMQLRESRGFSTMLMEAAAGAAEILGRGFLEYLRGGYGVIEGMFRAAFGVVLQEYRMSDLPGAAGARERFARETLQGMTPEEAARLGIPERFAGRQQRLMTSESRRQLMRDRGQFIQHASETRAPWLTQASSAQTSSIFAGGLADTMSTFKDTAKNMRSMINEVAERRFGNIENLTGYDVRSMYADNLARIQQAKATPEDTEVYRTLQRVRAAVPMRDTAGNQVWGREHVSVRPEGEKYQVGQRLPSGYVVVNVQQLNLRANSPQELQEQILRMNASPAIAAGAY